MSFIYTPWLIDFFAAIDVPFEPRITNDTWPCAIRGGWRVTAAAEFRHRTSSIPFFPSYFTSSFSPPPRHHRRFAVATVRLVVYSLKNNRGVPRRRIRVYNSGLKRTFFIMSIVYRKNEKLRTVKLCQYTIAWNCPTFPSQRGRRLNKVHKKTINILKNNCLFYVIIIFINSLYVYTSICDDFTNVKKCIHIYFFKFIIGFLFWKAFYTLVCSWNLNPKIHSSIRFFRFS